MNALAKPSRTARKIEKLKARRQQQTDERTNKTKARKRDGGRCRFPLCGCRALKLPPRVEVSHDRHKGMGGNPAGDRSEAAGLITLCEHRHQHGIFSRHAGTLRARYLTDDGNDGPVAWDIDAETLARYFGAGWLVVAVDGWVQIAHEFKVQVLAPLSPLQEHVLHKLAEMEL